MNFVKTGRLLPIIIVLMVPLNSLHAQKPVTINIQYSPCDSFGNIQALPQDTNNIYTYLLEGSNFSTSPRSQANGFFDSIPVGIYSLKIIDSLGDTTTFQPLHLGLKAEAAVLFQCVGIQPITLFRQFYISNGQAPYLLQAIKNSQLIPGFSKLSADSVFSLLDTFFDVDVKFLVTDACGFQDTIHSPSINYGNSFAAFGGR